jgi:hypothetical protein
MSVSADDSPVRNGLHSIAFEIKFKAVDACIHRVIKLGGSVKMTFRRNIRIANICSVLFYLRHHVFTSCYRT